METLEIKSEELYPSGDYMLVEPIGGEAQTKSGLIINVGSVGVTKTLGKIIRVGETAKYKEGATVMFRRYSVDEIEVNDVSGKKTLSFIESSDVICEIKKDGK